jgi:hypothetical protein
MISHHETLTLADDKKRLVGEMGGPPKTSEKKIF